MRTTVGRRWLTVAGARALSQRATSLVNATHDVNDSKIRFGRDGKQVEMLEVRPSECLRLKEEPQEQRLRLSSRIAKLRLRANLVQRVKCPMT